MNTIKDKLSRPLHDLRISLIDRCNFRCPYCMPESVYSKNYSFLKKNEWLSFDQIYRLTKIFVQLGTRKIRLTGGEPLLRPEVAELVSKLSNIPGIEDLALTTNGSLLDKFAKPLKDAGLNRLTISLDSLDAQTFHKMSGNKCNLDQVLKGVSAAINAGFEKLKFNVVIQKNINDNDILPIIDFFKNSNHAVRFIEYMDVGNCNHWSNDDVVTTKQMLEHISSKYQLESIESNYFGEVAKRYKLKDFPLEIGFISSISQPFCQFCTRVRISANGVLYTCLFAKNGVDLKSILHTQSDQEILETVSDVWHNREDRYSEIRDIMIKNSLGNQKIEMFHIGG